MDLESSTGDIPSSDRPIELDGVTARERHHREAVHGFLGGGASSVFATFSNGGGITGVAHSPTRLLVFSRGREKGTPLEASSALFEAVFPPTRRPGH